MNLRLFKTVKINPQGVYDTLSDGTVVRDCPVSFSQLHRQYGFRMKKEEILMPYEHDPMNEL